MLYSYICYFSVIFVTFQIFLFLFSRVCFCHEEESRPLFTFDGAGVLYTRTWSSVWNQQLHLLQQVKYLQSECIRIIIFIILHVHFYNDPVKIECVLYNFLNIFSAFMNYNYVYQLILGIELARVNYWHKSVFLLARHGLIIDHYKALT